MADNQKMGSASVAVVLPTMQSKPKRNINNVKLFNFGSWLKSAKSTIAVLSLIITIAAVGYLVNEKLNSFATKEEITDLVNKNDLAPIRQSIELLNQNVGSINNNVASLDANFDKMYGLFLELNFNKKPKNEK